MILAIVFAIIVGAGVGYMVARPRFASQRSVEAKLVFSFLLGQTAYLLLVLLNNENGSELWQGLALTYIPITICLFIVLLIVTMKQALKLKCLGPFVVSLGFLVLHLVGSYLVLFAWGRYFDFPL